MKKYILLSLLFCLLSGNTAYSQINELPRSTPEQEGVPSAIVSALLDSLFNIPQTDIHSVMMLRHGIEDLCQHSSGTGYRCQSVACYRSCGHLLPRIIAS